MVEERAYWLTWSQISRIGPILLKRLQQEFGTLAEAWKANAEALGQVEGFGRQTVEVVVQERSRLDPETLLEQHLAKNPCFWTPADADYPRLLLEIPNPPPVLYYRGKVEPLENQGIAPLVAIVGTRSPTEYGKRWTRQISKALAQQGFTIVSGMADGIDTESHTACIEAGGRTLAILGTGVDVVYPTRNRSLYEKILENGLVLSEYPQGTPPNRAHFPARNRIIAGLSRAVLVMEAPSKSGALITADVAKDFRRDIYALSARLDDYNSHGCLRLLTQGAQSIPIELDELLNLLGAKPPKNLDNFATLPLFNQLQASHQPALPKLEPELQQIMDAIAAEPTPFDLIVQKAELPAGTVSGALLQLELMGLISQLPGMRYQRG